ncbi:tripartite tricarboxylate transporter substrate binding protein [Verticiella sediminum]|uniref:Tripartite tricarboxylate transporter substrate binding protein n=1 Tax=Verticiella sediminum TaxID=1247510 RepID=A0A556AYN1_9BURK|nr:tripartite tricarboxylate transporter substrate binding protein [Verticiella sediminum]TSH98050.1 tripartite tricarboxylate transporter substrate binding protein [Verticiella sediminum]
MQNRIWRRLALCAAGLAMTAAAQGADYPTRAITMIVPFPPAGVADIVARPVAEALSRELGQSVVIENRPGAGGGLGIGQAARAQPDGYTLLMSLSSISILPAADRVLAREPAYRLDQFVPIARVTADPTVLAVRADAPWQSVEDFLADAGKRPKQINYGSSGVYGTMHLPMEMLAHDAGVELMHIPFTGGGPAVQALLGGQVDVLATGPSTVLQLIEAGRVRVLAHWGDEPLASLPDVPSLRSLGHDVGFRQWSGLFAIEGTPEPVVQRLRDAMAKVAQDERLNRTISATGSPVAYLDAQAFDEYWKEDTQVLTETVERIGKVD